MLGKAHYGSARLLVLLWVVRPIDDDPNLPISSYAYAFLWKSLISLFTSNVTVYGILTYSLANMRERTKRRQQYSRKASLRSLWIRIHSHSFGRPTKKHKIWRGDSFSPVVAIDTKRHDLIRTAWLEGRQWLPDIRSICETNPGFRRSWSKVISRSNWVVCLQCGLCNDIHVASEFDL